MVTEQGAPRPLPRPPSPISRPLSSVPSLIVPSGVIYFVCRDSIFFVVVIVVALEISMLCTLYHQLPPSPIKSRLCWFLCMPHLNKLTNPICHEIHPGVKTEVQKGELLHRVLTTTSCHLSQNGGLGSKLQSKRINVYLSYALFNVDFQNLENKFILNIRLYPYSRGVSSRREIRYVRRQILTKELG